jgi:hypothetical protein
MDPKAFVRKNIRLGFDGGDGEGSSWGNTARWEGKVGVGILLVDGFAWRVF